MKRWKKRFALSAATVAVLFVIPLAQADAGPAPTECGQAPIGPINPVNPTTGPISGAIYTTVEQPLWDLRATPGVSEVQWNVHDANCYVVVGVLQK